MDQERREKERKKGGKKRRKDKGNKNEGSNKTMIGSTPIVSLSLFIEQQTYHKQYNQINLSRQTLPTHLMCLVYEV